MITCIELPDGRFRLSCDCGWAIKSHQPAGGHLCPLADGSFVAYDPGREVLERLTRENNERRAKLKAEREAKRRAEIEANAPNLAQKGVNFTKASAKHMAAGFPQASDEDVARRFTICQSNVCGYYKAFSETNGQCLHPSCGCSLKAVGISGKNKLRWAEQECPVKMWLAVQPIKGD